MGASSGDSVVYDGSLLWLVEGVSGWVHLQGGCAVYDGSVAEYILLVRTVVVDT